MNFCPFQKGRCIREQCALFDGMGCGLCLTNSLDTVASYLEDIACALKKGYANEQQA